MRQSVFKKQFTLNLVMLHIVSWFAPTLPIAMCPCNDDSTHIMCLLMCIRLRLEEPPTLNLLNDSCNAKVLPDI
jgi:hypothetical protein